MENNILLCRAAIKTVWIYGIELWVYSSKSDVNMTEDFNRWRWKSLQVLFGMYLITPYIQTFTCLLEKSNAKTEPRNLFERLLNYKKQLAVINTKRSKRKEPKNLRRQSDYSRTVSMDGVPFTSASKKLNHEPLICMYSLYM